MLHSHLLPQLLPSSREMLAGAQQNNTWKEEQKEEKKVIQRKEYCFLWVCIFVVLFFNCPLINSREKILKTSGEINMPGQKSSHNSGE